MYSEARVRPLFALALVTFVAVTGRPQDPAYTSVVLEIGDRADAIVAEDVNGDGRTDLIVQSGLDLRFFLSRGNEGLQAAPDITLRLMANTFLWTLAKLCDDTGPSILTATSRGIHRYRRVNADFLPMPEDLVVHPSIFDGTLAPGRSPVNLAFMPDLNSDGLRDAVLFARGEALVMRQHRDGAGRPEFRLAQKLPIPIDSGLTMFFGPHQQVRELTSVPVIAFGDLNGDALPDVSYYQDDAIGMYFQTKEGRFTTENPVALGEKRKRRSSYLKFEVPPQIVDLNGDSLLDVVVVYASKGRTQVYMNRGGHLDFSNPDAVLKIAEGWSTGAYAKDLDRDGKMEIVMGVVRKFGLMGGIDVFVSKKINLELHVFRYDTTTNTYPAEPVQQLKFSVPYTFQATRESANIDLTFRPTFDADIDGDGKMDLLVEKGMAALAVYYGDKEKGFGDTAGATIALNPPSDCASMTSFVADLNGDKRSDLVLKYLRLEAKRHVVEVKLSK